MSVNNSDSYSLDTLFIKFVSSITFGNSGDNSFDCNFFSL